jgi:vancomycin resistance protein YoaR
LKTVRIAKRISTAVFAFAVFIAADVCEVCAYNGEDVFAGATSLVRDAFVKVRNSNSADTQEAAFNMEIEPTIERDLSGTILEGIYVDDINISGKTYDEAVKLIKDRVRTMSGASITLHSVGDNTVVVTAGQMGLKWDDTNMVADALYVGRGGNMVSRYKQRKDLEHEKIVYPLKLEFDRDFITSIVEGEGEKYNIEAKDATISKADGDFHITPGTKGEKIDVNASVSRILSALSSFKGSDISVDLVVVEDIPKADAEDLEKIHDIIGSYKTSFSTSSADRSGNVRNGTHLVDGTLLMPGESFSMYNTVSPFTEENGYFLAGSYLNGMVVESLGGGICQVSSTLYNAVLRAELQVVERNSHSMVVNYVDKSADAAIAESSGKDFRFVNNTDYPIYIEGYTENKKITFNIYGVETRDPGRKVEFESEIVTETVPDHEDIVADASQPIGYVSATSAHIGYTAKLWKIVYENGVEVSREVVNNSTYKATPRTAVVGIASANPEYTAAMQAAIATGSIDNCKAMAAQLNEMAAAAAAQAAMDQSASVDP